MIRPIVELGVITKVSEMGSKVHTVSVRGSRGEKLGGIVSTC